MPHLMIFHWVTNRPRRFRQSKTSKSLSVMYTVSHWTSALKCIQAFSNPFDGHDLAQHSRSYASTRYFRQVKDSDFAQGEAALVAFNLYRVVWVMMGFFTAKLVILELVIPNFAELQGAGRPLDWGLWALVAGGAILGIFGITCGFVISLARTIAGNLNRPLRLPAAQAPNFGQVSQALGHHPIFSALPSTALEELAKGTKRATSPPKLAMVRQSYTIDCSTT